VYEGLVHVEYQKLLLMLTGGWRKKDELIDDVFFGNKSEVLGDGLDSLLSLL
jgi:hypothetical protein